MINIYQYLRFTILSLLFGLWLMTNSQVGMAQEVIITGILDGTITGGTPKVVELYVNGTNVDLSNYRLEAGDDGKGYDRFGILSGTYSNEFVYLLGADFNGPLVFENIFGNTGDFANVIVPPSSDAAVDLISFDGNDAVRIVNNNNGAPIDEVGDPNDGTTLYFQNSYMYRQGATCPNPDWIGAGIADWDRAGNDALDGFNEAGILATVPFGTYTPPGTIDGDDLIPEGFAIGSTDNILYQFVLNAADPSRMQTFSVGTISAGGDLDALVTNFKFYVSTDATLDAGDTELASVAPTDATFQLLNFAGFDDIIAPTTDVYYFLTADIRADAPSSGASLTVDPNNIAFGFLETRCLATDYTAALIHDIGAAQTTDMVAVPNSEADEISSIINTDSPLTTDPTNSTQVWQFTIREGGATGDSDELPTQFSELVIRPGLSFDNVVDWTLGIQACELFDNAGNRIAQATIENSPNRLLFTFATPLEIADNAQETFSLRMTIRPNLGGNAGVDGENYTFAIQADESTTVAGNSGLADFANINSDITKNVIAVVATELQFSTQVSSLGVGDVMSPVPRLEARDANGNLDIDFNEDITITSTGTMQNDPLTENIPMGAGSASFSNIIHTEPGVNLTLEATSPGLTAVTSDLFTVFETSILYPGDLLMVGFNNDLGLGFNQIQVLVLVDIQPFTRFIISNAIYERDAVANVRTNDWNTVGAVEFQVLNNPIPAGSIIRFDIDDDDSSIPTNIRLNGAVYTDLSASNLNISAGAGININFAIATFDQMYIMQGEWIGTDFTGRLIHGVSNGIDWTPFTVENDNTAGRRSRLHPDIQCINVTFPAVSSWYYDRNTINGDQRSLVTAINDPNNWVSNVPPAGSDDPFTVSANWNLGLWRGNNDASPNESLNAYNCAYWDNLSLPDSTININIDILSNDDFCEVGIKPDSIINSLACLDLDITDKGLQMAVTGAANPTLDIYGNVVIEIPGRIDHGEGQFNFVGSNLQMFINEAMVDTLYQANINKPNEVLQLDRTDVVVLNTLSLTEGDFDLNGQNLTLGPNASLSEVRLDISGNDVNHVVLDNSILPEGGPGLILAPNRIYNEASLGTDIGGLGLYLQNGAGQGAVTIDIERGHASIDANGRPSIKKTFDIEATAGNVNNTQMQFHYADADFRDFPPLANQEFAFTLARRPDPTLPWEDGLIDILDDANNFVQYNTINGFSTWTITSLNVALPVELLSFTGKKIGEEEAELNWITQTEFNNLGFAIEKSSDGKNFQAIAWVDGAGNTIQRQNYVFIDKNFKASSYYRLKQIDANQKFEYSPILFIETEPAFTFYPNPVQEKLQIIYGDPQQALRLRLVDSQGKILLDVRGNLAEIERTLNRQIPYLNSGIYIIQLNNGQKLYTKKLSKF